jgi:xylitol oxidase
MSNSESSKQITKRDLLKLLPAAAAMASISGAEEKPSNWAGNIQYSTEKVEECGSVDQVRAFVKKMPKFKPLGTRHCFNRIADSKDYLLSMRNLNKVLSLDAAGRTVTVEAGIRYGQLGPYLHEKGFALHNLASLPHISVAGSCSTGTHGSGEKNGNLSSAVVGLELVTAQGDLVEFSRRKEADKFHGAVVSLGAIGVITHVTLAIEPAYQARQYVYENLPLRQMQDHFDQIQASGYSVSLFTDWQKKRVNEVWVKCKDSDPFKGPQDLFGATLATRNLHPIAELSAENCTEQMGVAGPWYDRLPHFKMGFTPSAGKELQAEYFVPRKHAVEAILAIERMGAEIGPHLMISEIRTIAADDLWMSPCYQQDCVAIHFTWKPDWPAVSRLLPKIERELAPFQGRPHWGKLFTTSPAVLRKIYEKLPSFVQLCQELDPKGKLRNDYLKRNIFGG